MDKKENSSLVELEVNKRKEIYQIKKPNKKQDYLDLCRKYLVANKNLRKINPSQHLS